MLKYPIDTLFRGFLLMILAVTASAQPEHPVTIKATAALPMPAVISMISDMSGLNIIVTQEVAKMNVLVNARNLPAMDVLRHLALAYDFRLLEQDDGTVVIMTAREFTTSRSVPANVVTFSLQNVRAESLVDIVRTQLSDTGEVHANKETNQLVVSDKEEILEQLAVSIHTMDKTLLTEVFELHQVSSKDAMSLLQGIVQPPGQLSGDETGRFLTVTDTPGNIAKIRKALSEIDIADDIRTEIFQLNFASCEDVGRTLEELFSEDSRRRYGMGGGFGNQYYGGGGGYYDQGAGGAPPGRQQNQGYGAADGQGQPGGDPQGSQATGTAPGARPAYEKTAFTVGHRGMVVIDSRNNAIIVTAEEMWIDRIREIVTAMDSERKPYRYTFAFAELESLDLEEKLASLLDNRAEQYQIDVENRAVAFFSTPKRAPLILDMLQAWDKVPQQVTIAAKLLSVSDDTIKKLGIDFVAQDNKTLFGGNQLLKNEGIMSLAPVIAAGSPFAELSLGSLETTDYNALIRAISTDSKTRIITEPRINTLNNKPAMFSDARQEPYTVVTKDGQTNTVLQDVRFLDVGVTLEVLPHINEYDDVKLDIMLKLSHLIQIRDGYPVVDTTMAKATSRTKNGQAVLLGGLQLRQTKHMRDGVPFLKDIPILGLPFRSTDRDKTDRQLMLIITPFIDDPQVRDEEEFNARLLEELVIDNFQ